MQSALCTAIAFYLTIGMFEALWSLLLRDLGAETWLIGLTLSLFTIPMILFASKGGRLAQSRGPLRVMSVSIVVAAACTAVYGFGPLWVLIVASGIHAVADAYTLPGNQVAVAMASPADQIATGQGLLGRDRARRGRPRRPRRRRGLRDLRPHGGVHGHGDRDAGLPARRPMAFRRAPAPRRAGSNRPGMTARAHLRRRARPG